MPWNQAGVSTMARATLSQLEIVGVAMAAAGALGGVVMALSRAQDSATAQNPVRRRVGQLRGASGDTRAAQTMEQLYDSAADLVARIPSELSARSHAVLEVLPGQQKQPAWRRLALPGVRRRRSRLERLADRAPRPPTTEQIQAAAADAVRAIRPRIAAVRPVAESARQQVQQSLAEVRESDLVQQSGPALRQFSEQITEKLDDVRTEASDALSDAPQRIAEIAGERARQLREAVPEAPLVELPAPKTVAKQGGSAAKETLATLVWLVAASTVVYFVVLSAERREQLKSWACARMEQVQLLALDLKGYEPDM
jgi:hypothetical protein